MTEPDLSFHDRKSYLAAHGSLILACASLGFSLWVSIAYPRPGSFFVRYDVVSLGIAIINGMVIKLKQPREVVKFWLWALWTIALAVSCVGSVQSIVQSFR
jgi:hypothetical protein